MREPVPCAQPRPIRQPVPREPVPQEPSQALAIVQYVTPYALIAIADDAHGEPPIMALARQTNLSLMALDKNFDELQRSSVKQSNAFTEATVASINSAVKEGACPECGGPLRPGERYCSNKCAETFTENHNAQVQAIFRRKHEEEQFIEEQKEMLAQRYEAAETKKLVALGRDQLRTELERLYPEVKDLREKSKVAVHRAKRLRESIAGLQVVRVADDAELQNARELLRVTDQQLSEVYTKLRDAERDLKKLGHAWRSLREHERDARIGGHWPKTFCPVCVTETHDGLIYCDNACLRQRHAADHPEGQRCAFCRRAFTAPEMIDGRIRQVWAYVGLDGLERVDVCSLECWRALVVDEDKPPYFPPAVYLPPPPLTAAERVRLSRQRMADAAQPDTTTPPSARAPQTQLDRYVAFLREHGPAIDPEASAATGIREGALRYLRHVHGDLFLKSDERARGARWTLR